MKIVTLTRGGQVSIPAEYRRNWTSTRVMVEATERGLLLRPIPEDPIGAAMGSLAGKGKPGMTGAKALAQARAEERAIEKRKWGRGGS